ncbi:hypothetical protein FPV67DRAFT_513708 [Lyophyllum atratum]|nr:hypothetical protein FPV67DRAFT_513708 [Lyophyllum atratum]
MFRIHEGGLGCGDEKGLLAETCEKYSKSILIMNKINIEIRRSTTPGKRVILVQGPC